MPADFLEEGFVFWSDLNLLAHRAAPFGDVVLHPVNRRARVTLRRASKDAFVAADSGEVVIRIIGAHGFESRLTEAFSIFSIFAIPATEEVFSK